MLASWSGKSSRAELSASRRAPCRFSFTASIVYISGFAIVIRLHHTALPVQHVSLRLERPAARESEGGVYLDAPWDMSVSRTCNSGRHVQRAVPQISMQRGPCDTRRVRRRHIVPLLVCRQRCSNSASQRVTSYKSIGRTQGDGYTAVDLYRLPRRNTYRN